jgi:hypothetical protein
MIDAAGEAVSGGAEATARSYSIFRGLVEDDRILDVDCHRAAICFVRVLTVLPMLPLHDHGNFPKDEPADYRLR